MKPLKVALVVPNFLWCDWDPQTKWSFIPINLCLLAAMIKSFCEVVLIDANHNNFNEEQLAAKIKDFAPDVVGITVLMDQYAPSCHYAAKVIKNCCPQTVIVTGGVHTTMNPIKVLSDQNIDYVIIGEGEYVFQDLLRYISGESSFPQKGIGFRKDEKIICLDRADLITDLDSLPFPDYSMIDYLSYVTNLPDRRSLDMPPKFPYARIITSRGCLYDCLFCQGKLISGQFRARSAKNVLDEISWLKYRYDIKSLTFDDDNLFINRKRAIEIFNGLRKFAMPWVSIATPAFPLDENLLDLMAASGCEYIDLAIESGNEKTLREIIGKPLSLAHAKKVVKAARERGIFTAANFIVGLPHETWDDIRQTIKFAEEIDADYIKIFAAVPLPGTRLWKLCEETNSFKELFSVDNIRWSAGQIETKEFSAQDTTVLRSYEWDRLNFTDPIKRRRIAERMRITEEELLQIRRQTLQNAISMIRK